MTRVLHFLFIVLVALQGAASLVYAANVVETPQTRATIIVDRTEVAPGETMTVGLSLNLKPGWHTYWRNPGDSGLPAELTWELPQGIAAGPIHWPAPHRIPTGDLMNFGYDGHAVLPLTLEIGQDVALGPVVLQVHALWLACEEICIPEEGSFTVPLNVVAGPTLPQGPEAVVLTRAASQVPSPAPWPVNFSGDATHLVLRAGPSLDTEVAAAEFFPYGEQVLENAAPQDLDRQEDQIRLHLKPRTQPPERIEGVLVVENAQGERTGYEVGGDVAAIAPDAMRTGDMTILLALVFAFIGGLILNLMPCVLPVLVMKVLTVMKHQASPSMLRRDALVYTAGVLTAFTLLVAILLALRAAGEAVGWGFQLQDPTIVALLAGVMLALGLSLSGVFSIGGSVAGVGQSLAAKDGGWGAFFTGVLAVVVATPCTAPFMGAALGFAMTQPPVMTLIVFEGLALGLAFPYLLIAFVPRLTGVIPRAGAWSERLKQVLAFALYGAAAWLVWVLAQQVDAPGLALALAGLLCVAFAAWGWGVANEGYAVRPGWMAASLIALFLAFGAMVSLDERPFVAADLQPAGDIAEPYSANRLDQLRAEGRPVFVNFTAAWCITCLLNERVALSHASVTAALEKNGVVYMKADWTNRDPEITGAIHALGRDGVPVYVLYAPGNEPKLLPQILTPGLVVESLNSLRSP